MGGESKTSSTQNSTTAPWQNAQPAIGGILDQIQGGLKNTGVTGAENNALTTMVNNGNTAASYAPSIRSYATSLFNGGGATDQAGNINQNYARYVAQTNPMASNTDYNPYNTPGFRDAINTATSDITNGVNGTFAGAGRDFSGANSMALGRGITQGIAPTIANQYNSNVQNQQGAANNLFNGGNTNAGLLAGLQQQYLVNQGQGAGAVGQATDAANSGANATLQAEAQRRGIPVQALGLLAQLGIPIAGLGSQSTGQSQGTQQMSGAQQFATIAGGFGSLMPKVNLNISDRRAKEDIAQVGTLFDGTPVYRYHYIGKPDFHIGLMAQDVEKYAPEAVGMIGEYKAVDYKLATDKALEAA